MTPNTPAPASELPWALENERIVSQPRTTYVALMCRDTDQFGAEAKQDADYIVHCCNSLPALRAENERMRAALQALVETHDDPEYGNVDVMELIDTTARLALKGTP